MSSKPKDRPSTTTFPVATPSNAPDFSNPYGTN